MSEKHTDHKLLAKGLKYMAITLPLLFLCPYLITLSFLNKDNYTFYIFFILGIIAGGFAFFFFYKGIKTLMDSIF
ncbi:MAG: hypothetical protein ACI9SJ_000350 [Flavobacteriaceae bacterium]|jgi:hypothetical protein|uniref:DUF6095 family protein n=1 Tax=Candidatus Marifrigoribacter sp. Uisw_064 TaxID=3230970 RepID=UPI003ADEEB94